MIFTFPTPRRKVNLVYEFMESTDAYRPMVRTLCSVDVPEASERIICEFRGVLSLPCADAVRAMVASLYLNERFQQDAIGGSLDTAT